MGLLDLTSPALSLADAKLALVLPSIVRIMAWAGIGAALSMGIYWLLSPQKKLARMAIDEQRLKLALRDGESEIADGLASAARLLRLAMTRVGLTFLPVLAAAVPVICLATWLQTHYAHDLPPSGQTVAVKVDPRSLQGRWIAAGDGTARVDVADDEGAIVHSHPILLPVPLIHKQTWWSALIGNPLGYLQPEGAVERIEIALPVKHYLSMGPDWLRGWEAPFVAALFFTSILLKLVFRIR